MKNFSKIIYANLFIVLIILSFLLSGCATFFGDNTRQIVINSNPSGAKIFIDNVESGITNNPIILPTYIFTPKTILLKKEGYQDGFLIINSKFQAVGLWNILFWPGFIIDAATGSMFKIDPNNLTASSNLQLEKK